MGGRGGGGSGLEGDEITDLEGGPGTIMGSLAGRGRSGARGIVFGGSGKAKCSKDEGGEEGRKGENKVAHGDF